MSARKIFLRVGAAVDHLAESVGWLGAVMAFLALIYLLAAPPVVLVHVKHTGSASFPAVYGPVLWLIESDFGGPMVWYFNDVWGVGLMLIGGDEGPPWYIIAAYVGLGAILLGALALPFLKIWRRRNTARRLHWRAGVQFCLHSWLTAPPAVSSIVRYQLAVPLPNSGAACTRRGGLVV